MLHIVYEFTLTVEVVRIPVVLSLRDNLATFFACFIKGTSGQSAIIFSMFFLFVFSKIL